MTRQPEWTTAVTPGAPVIPVIDPLRSGLHQIDNRRPPRGYQVCTRCVMDTSDEDITFDAAGVCNHCHRFETVVKPRWFPDARGAARLEALLAEIRSAGRGREYDCIMGLSGGVDSSYLAWLASRWGLRILIVHVDAGWNSELAVRNIECVLRATKFDLMTHVVDWEEMRDLQLAYLRSGICNQDVPQDHVFFTVLYRLATERGIRHVLTGSNVATESIIPPSWVPDAMDARQLRAIHRRFGRLPLRSYQTISLWDLYLVYPYWHRMRIVKPLDCLPYDKAAAKRILETEIGWKDYGVKHGESRFTRFFQNFFLPARFGYDKRRPHLSSLIVAGSMTRDEALAELARPLYDQRSLRDDRRFIQKKLGLTEAELDGFITAPIRTFRDYPSYHAALSAFRRAKGRLLDGIRWFAGLTGRG